MNDVELQGKGVQREWLVVLIYNPAYSVQTVFLDYIRSTVVGRNTIQISPPPFPARFDCVGEGALGVP